MKGKASLTLIELTVMLLVFSLAAALCLRGFVWADQHSVYHNNADRAMEQAQETAEYLKHTKGDLSAAAERFGGTQQGDTWLLSFSEDWEPTDSGAFTLLAEKQAADTPGLGSIRIQVTRQDGEVLALLTVCYQEVTENGEK